MLYFRFVFSMLWMAGSTLTLAMDSEATPVQTEFTSSGQGTYLEKVLDTLGPALESPCSEHILKLYTLSGGKLIWSSAGELTQQGINAVTHLNHAADHGLNPHAYLVEELEHRLSALRNSSTVDSGTANLSWTEFDVVLSRALIHFISDIYRGRINPLETGFNVIVSPKQIDPVGAVHALSRSLEFDQEIQQFEPRLRAYQRLKHELARYRNLFFGKTFPVLVGDKTVHPGDEYSDTEELKLILTALGDYFEPSVSSSNIYSGELKEAVRRFQIRHGLEDDGVIGKKTFAQLNTPISRRIEQIELSMERLRWLSTPENGQHIVVNIPAFELYGFEVENGIESLIAKMKVIVGSAIDKHNTPVFAANMEYLVFRPYWNVPFSITVNELLPKLTREPGYLDENRYEILQGNEVIDSSEVDDGIVANLHDGTYRIRQRPGENNALGLIKFIFPNSNSVYLHDTPTHSLFSQSRRDFSHGCIRVEDPPGLAEFVLRDQETPWKTDEIILATQSRDDQKVSLENNIPVHIFYTTTIVRENGELAFFDDIYGHDQTLRRLLIKHGADHCNL